jgi:hypothetical protein
MCEVSFYFELDGWLVKLCALFFMIFFLKQGKRFVIFIN